MLTCTSGTTGSVGRQNGGRLRDGQVLPVDGEVELGSLGVHEAQVRGRDGLGEEQERFCNVEENTCKKKIERFEFALP